jgi:hypothetical protein
VDNFKKKEVVVKEFTIEVMSNPFGKLKSLEYAQNKKNLRKLSAVLILAIIDLVKNENLDDTLQMKQFIRKQFYARFINIDTFDVESSMYEMSSIKDSNVPISFFIWCIDSFCYFIEESSYSYEIMKNYATSIEKAIKKFDPTSSIFEISEFFYHKLLCC